jgi:hypothetical protein
MNKIQELAKDALSFFYRKKRREDDENEIWVYRSDRPDWLQNLVHDAHGNMIPDDWRYSFIVEALNAIEENTDLDEACESLDSDIYTSDLTGWLHSRNDRVGYVTDARDELGRGEGGLNEDNARGQLMEKYEVLNSVYKFLEELAEERE